MRTERRELCADFKSVRQAVSPEDWQARVELAACYRLVDKLGMTDLIYNHITARVPGTEHLPSNLCGWLYQEIAASDAVKIDQEGKIRGRRVTDDVINRPGYVIHGACATRQVHAARPNPGGMATSNMACRAGVQQAGHTMYQLSASWNERGLPAR